MNDQEYIKSLEARIKTLEEKLDGISFSGECLTMNNCTLANLRVTDSAACEVSHCTFAALNTGNTAGLDIHECKFESVNIGDSSSCDIHECGIGQVKKQ